MSVSKEAIEAAEREFTEYFVRNYPGPDTIIFDPKWHAPKLFRAATHSLISSPGKDGGQEERQNYNCGCVHPSQCDRSCFGVQPASTALVERLERSET